MPDKRPKVSMNPLSAPPIGVTAAPTSADDPTSLTINVQPPVKDGEANNTPPGKDGEDKYKLWKILRTGKSVLKAVFTAIGAILLTIPSVGTNIENRIRKIMTEIIPMRNKVIAIESELTSQTDKILNASEAIMDTVTKGLSDIKHQSIVDGNAIEEYLKQMKNAIAEDLKKRNDEDLTNRKDLKQIMDKIDVLSDELNATEDNLKQMRNAFEEDLKKRNNEDLENQKDLKQIMDQMEDLFVKLTSTMRTKSCVRLISPKVNKQDVFYIKKQLQTIKSNITFVRRLAAVAVTRENFQAQ
uniref:Uncharacterized protein n=1 Tax=Ananas comosus var. bracteatus TaxID=296719 RepID=A0A6V7Q9V9_ANACO|nr:unnamed protein product [Ananas comosus var. bracteatus]